MGELPIEMDGKLEVPDQSCSAEKEVILSLGCMLTQCLIAMD